MPILGAIFGWLSTFLANSALRFVAWKAILTVVVLSVFPILLNNALHEVMTTVYAAVNSHGGGPSSFMYQATGFTAWLFNRLRVPEIVSLYVSAIGFKFALGLIPFIRA